MRHVRQVNFDLKLLTPNFPIQFDYLNKIFLYIYIATTQHYLKYTLIVIVLMGKIRSMQIGVISALSTSVK